jgi:hypothetical protein
LVKKSKVKIQKTDMFNKLKEKGKNIANQAKESAKGLLDKHQEISEETKFDEENQDQMIEKISIDEEQYSDEDKQRELGNLAKLVIKAENVIKD